MPHFQKFFPHFTLFVIPLPWDGVVSAGSYVMPMPRGLILDTTVHPKTPCFAHSPYPPPTTCFHFYSHFKKWTNFPFLRSSLLVNVELTNWREQPESGRQALRAVTRCWRNNCRTKAELVSKWRQCRNNGRTIKELENDDRMCCKVVTLRNHGKIG